MSTFSSSACTIEIQKTVILCVCVCVCVYFRIVKEQEVITSSAKL